MWWWTLLGWSAASVGLAAVFHRLVRSHGHFPPEVAAFLVELENTLAARHPDVQYRGLLVDRFACLLGVDGQETPVGLHAAFRHAQAFPNAWPRLVDQLIREVRQVGLDEVADVDFAAAAPRLLPQVRSRAWLGEHGCFGDAGLAFRWLGPDLASVYVLDAEDTMVFVCRSHLRHWRKSVDDIHHLAVANLARRSSADWQQAATAAPQVLQSGDSYDAARSLLLEQTQGLLVAMPDRDTLWVGPATGQDLAALMATTAELAAGAPHPISSQVYAVKDGRFEAVRGSAQTPD